MPSIKEASSRSIQNHSGNIKNPAPPITNTLPSPSPRANRAFPTKKDSSPRAQGKQFSTRGQYGDRVTVTISSYKCPPDLLERSAKSILSQTYKNILLVVVADGDPSELDILRSIKDPRLVLHAYEKNRSQFFAHDIVARATPDPFFAIQDSDDWSTPDRIEKQVQLLTQHNADLAFTSLIQHDNGKTWKMSPRPDTLYARNHALPPIGLHVGMYRTETLLAVGGYFCGIRLGYDSLAILKVARHGRCVYHDVPLYHRQVRAASMTNQATTNFHSSARKEAVVQLESLYAQIRTHTKAKQTERLITSNLDEDAKNAQEKHVRFLKGKIPQAPKKGSAKVSVKILKKLRVAFVAPTRVKNGGFARHVEHLAQGLRGAGNEVIVSAVEESGGNIPDCDIVIFFGWYHATPTPQNTGDGEIKRDWYTLLKTLAAARQKNIPVIINSTWDNHPKRLAWLIKASKEIRKANPACRIAVFSPFSLDNPKLDPIRDMLTVVHHPVHVPTSLSPMPDYQDRRGICIGELGKLGRPRYTRGQAIPEMVKEIQEALPGVPIHAYAQYANAQTPRIPGVIVDRPNPQKFLAWLSQFRLFVSLTCFETFSMVPVEAQAVGIPVLYRTMPQSLSGRLGLTALPIDKPGELGTMSRILYSDPNLWTTFHEAGLANAQANNTAVACAQWNLVLHNLIENGATQ